MICVDSSENAVGVRRLGGGSDSGNVRTDRRRHGPRQRPGVHGRRDCAPPANAVQHSHRVSG